MSFSLCVTLISYTKVRDKSLPGTNTHTHTKKMQVCKKTQRAVSKRPSCPSLLLLLLYDSNHHNYNKKPQSPFFLHILEITALMAIRTTRTLKREHVRFFFFSLCALFLAVRIMKRKRRDELAHAHYGLSKQYFSPFHSYEKQEAADNRIDASAD